VWLKTRVYKVRHRGHLQRHDLPTQFHKKNCWLVQKIFEGHRQTDRWTNRQVDRWTDIQNGGTISLTFLFKDSKLKSVYISGGECAEKNEEHSNEVFSFINSSFTCSDLRRYGRVCLPLPAATTAFISSPGLCTVGECSWILPSLAELSIKTSIGLAGTVLFDFTSRGLQLHVLGWSTSMYIASSNCLPNPHSSASV
jgi:hypothetical protein